jgi:hypothetical protein
MTINPQEMGVLSGPPYGSIRRARQRCPATTPMCGPKATPKPKRKSVDEARPTP